MIYEEGNAFKTFVRPQGYRQGLLVRNTATLTVNTTFGCLQKTSPGHLSVQIVWPTAVFPRSGMNVNLNI